MGEYTVRRFITIFFVLLLVLMLATASADMVSISELHQQAEAVGRWTQTYETPNGKVNVDIPIIVPEVENVPILQVSAVMGKDVAEERGLAKAADQENAGAGIFYDDFDILSKLNADVDDAAMIFCANPEEIDLAFLQISHNDPNSMRRGSWDYSSDYYYLNEVNPEMLFAEENDQPLSAANDVLAVLLQNYYGNENADYDVDYVEVRGKARKRVGRTKNDLGAYKKDYPKGTYYISFRQKIGGLPVYMEIGQKMLTTDKTHVTQETALKCSRVSWININGLEYMDGASFMLNATWMREEKRIQEDVPLATLDRVLESIEKEITTGRIRNIHALRLGYMRYSNPEMEDYAWAVPMWVLDCDYVPSGKRRVVDSFHEHFELNRWEAYEFAQIPLNAQTGEMKIITTGDEATFAVPEMTTWEDIQ